MTLYSLNKITMINFGKLPTAYQLFDEFILFIFAQ